MSKPVTIHITETVHAPIERVFDHLADHRWFVGLFGGTCERVVDGREGGPDGLGSVRRIGPGPLGFEETIVVFERPERIHYQITRGSPLKNHLGEIHLREDDGVTHIDYRIRFEGKVPLVAGLVERALTWAWSQNAATKLKTLE